MNKYQFFAYIIIYLVLTSIMVSAVGLSAPALNTPGSPADGLSGIWLFLNGFISIMTFSVSGIPTMINMIFFFWVPFVVGFMVIDVIKDLIPFT